MRRRFNKSYESSFQSKVINDLRLLKQQNVIDLFNLNITKESRGVARILADSLEVDHDIFITKLMEAEISRMVNIKRRNSSFEEMNTFYNEVVTVSPEADSEISELVANYFPIELSQIQSERLIKHAKSRLGLRFNNYRAYRLANFDSKPTIEIIFYLDHANFRYFRNAWIGTRGAALKNLSFCDINSLNEYVNQVSIFANLFNLDFMHVGPKGLRYER